MRVLMMQKSMGLFATTGEYKANTSLLRYLASRGHATAQFCFTYDGEIERAISKVEAGGAKASVSSGQFQMITEEGNPTDIKYWSFTNVNGIYNIALDADAITKVFPTKLQAKETKKFLETEEQSIRLQAYTKLLFEQISLFKPTHILFSDPLWMKATSVMDLEGAKRIFIIHCAEQLPFGPYAGGIPNSACSPAEHELLKQCNGVWAVSKAVKNYAWKYGQLETACIPNHAWIYLDERTQQLPRRRYNWNKGLVGMINPSRVKGVHILLKLAKRMPEVGFVCWRSWAMHDEIRKALEEQPNIELRDPTTNMEEAWDDIKVLLVPSLWLEAWGIVVVEAQLRGIPVLASDAGALPESKLGVPHIIPVKALTGEHDEDGQYTVPEQDIEPWVEPLDTLLKDEEEYKKLAEQARTVTADYVKNLDDTAIEKWMISLARKQ
ncbi:glycosyltransferase family 4 protein [Patellaria atrata CBS 101060]|uniref:Glycosyltransferase family 4 protein n=1 Tax=Patellaria atrata CBS 101060 TaxID=1346257 RepID=A0A9P4SFW6_9PEZI|nr:glycosyltransferase family 4 protein [Patellaria atrata CBS 101060]